MAKVPADLHIHIDNNLTKETAIKILQAAEANGLKAICILEHNNINFYRRGGILEELLIEGIEKYYTGKIISGVELNCTIKDAPVSPRTGIDYNGYDMHIHMYGFNPNEIQKKVDWFNAEVDAVRYYSDVDTLLGKLKELNLPLPPKSHFRFAEGVKPFKQLYKYIEASQNKPLYNSVLGSYPHSSSFVRHLAYSPTSKIYFDRAQSPSIVDVINVGNDCAALLCIAYPYHINRNLITDVNDYMDVLQSIPSKAKGKNFNSVEGPYMLNTEDETGEILYYAKENDLAITAGSDYQPQEKMYYLPPEANEKVWYVPSPGLYIRQLLEGGRGILTVEEEVLAKLPDVRDFGYYRVATAEDLENEARAQHIQANLSVQDLDAINDNPHPVEETPVAQATESVEQAPSAETPVVESATPAAQETVATPATEEVVETPVVEEVAAEEDPAPVAADIAEAQQVQAQSIENVERESIDIPEDNDDEDAGQVPMPEVEEVVATPVVEAVEETEEVVETPAIEEVEEVETPAIEEVEEVETPAVEEIEEVEEVAAPEVEKVEAPKPAPAKKPAAPKKAPAKKPAAAKKPAKKEETADALDDTMALLEQLTSDFE